MILAIFVLITSARPKDDASITDSDDDFKDGLNTLKRYTRQFEEICMGGNAPCINRCLNSVGLRGFCRRGTCVCE